MLVHEHRLVAATLGEDELCVFRSLTLATDELLIVQQDNTTMPRWLLHTSYRENHFCLGIFFKIFLGPRQVEKRIRCVFWHQRSIDGLLALVNTFQGRSRL